MEQRKEIVRHFVSLGFPVVKAVGVTNISKSTYYYKPNGRLKGKKPSVETVCSDQRLPNEMVVTQIEKILLQDDFIDYGYQRTCQKLKKLGFKINHKKVYRLMKENKLLYPKRKTGAPRTRNFVKYTTPEYKHPFATIEVDIKYIYIEGARRHAYLVTLLDTFTRIAIDWSIGYQMKNTMISPLINRSLENELVKPYAEKSTLKIRTDNGPQFISLQLAKTLQQLPVDQEFIQPATPQQNGHVESFHHTIKRLVTDKFIFQDLDEAKSTLCRFYNTYNNVRIMKSILYCSPMEFLKIWEEGKIGIEERKKQQIFFFRERQSLA